MRIGDLDKLRETIEDHVTSVSVCATTEEARGQTYFKKRCLDDIDDAPTIDAITVSWIEDQISQHTSDTGWTDWWGDMCRRFLQEYERRRDDEKAD